MNYTILQQINPTFRVTEEENIKKEQYKTVYSGTIEEEDLNINQILENIFIKFNIIFKIPISYIPFYLSKLL